MLAKILKMIEAGPRKLPKDISCEGVESGICLTGGGSCITGMMMQGKTVARATARSKKNKELPDFNGADRA